MTEKRRHKTIDLGTIAVNDYSQEIDLSSFTHAVLFYEWPTAATGSITQGQPEIEVWFSPTEFGEEAVWYEMHTQLTYTLDPWIPRRIAPNSMAPQARLNAGDENYFERDRAIPIQATEPFIVFAHNEWVWGNQPLPRRMRLRSILFPISGFVQLSREVG